MPLLNVIRKAFLSLLCGSMFYAVLFYFMNISKNNVYFPNPLKVRNNLLPSRISYPNTCPFLLKGIPINITGFKMDHDENDHETFLDMTWNCSEFLKNRGYFLSDASQEEKDFPLAFSILLYSYPYQFERLLRAIYRPHNYYCIHIDNKSKSSFKECINSVAECLPNVFVARELKNVYWGGFSIVEAEMSCMKDLLQYKKWKYLINLTGQEFPLKTNLQIVKILKVLNGANDINSKIYPRKLFRVLYNYDGHGKRLGRKEPPPFNMTVLTGSTHITVTREFTDFLINSRNAQIFLNWANGTKIPDETVFSMLNGNPHIGTPGAFKGSLSTINAVPFLSRYKIWSDDYKPLCGGHYIRGVCILEIADLPRLAKSFQLFANKFHGTNLKGTITLNCLDEWLYNQTRYEQINPDAFDLTVYRMLPQVYPKNTTEK